MVWESVFAVNVYATDLSSLVRFVKSALET